MRTSRQLIGLGLALGLVVLPATGTDLKDLYFGEALFHALQGQYFDALQRLDTELAMYRGLDQPELDSLHYHINDAEFDVGDFELNYRMHHRAGRAIKAVLEGAVDEAVRNEAAFRLARIHFQKGQLDDALNALGRIQGTVPAEIQDDVEFLRANVYLATGRPSEAVTVLQQVHSDESLSGFVAYNLGIALLQDNRQQEAIAQLDKAGQLPATDRAGLAIRDKTNLVLGTILFESGNFDRARQAWVDTEIELHADRIQASGTAIKLVTDRLQADGGRVHHQHGLAHNRGLEDDLQRMALGPLNGPVPVALLIRV